VTPVKPKGGEGLRVEIADNSPLTHTISFRGISYRVYRCDENKKEAFIPIGIETTGKNLLKVSKKFLFFTVETKTLEINVTPCKINKIILKESDEKMRDDQPAVDVQQDRVLQCINTKSKFKLWSGAFQVPIKSKSKPNFANRRTGKTHDYYHKGIDLGGKKRTAIKATNSGRIILAGENFNVYGNVIVIDHGQGVVSCYFHLNKLLKKENDMVSKGEIIAQLGNTGWSTAPHLHFGVYLHSDAVDPLWWIEFTSNISHNIK